MPEVNAVVTCDIELITLNAVTIVSWKNPDGSDGKSTTPKKIELSLSDFSESTQKEIIEKL